MGSLPALIPMAQYLSQPFNFCIEGAHWEVHKLMFWQVGGDSKKKLH
jgi:hypothetical protein